MGDSSGFSAFCQCLTGKYCLVSKTEMKCLRDLQNNFELFLSHKIYVPLFMGTRGGDIARTADPNRPKGYPTPCGVMLNNMGWLDGVNGVAA